MLLSIHEQFRAAAQQLVHLVATEPGAVAIRRGFARLAQVLHHHHHAEEAMVFPMILRRSGVAPHQLQVDHDELTAAIAAVEASLAAEDPTRLHATIARFVEVLVTHLDREEELVIPLFLTLPPDQLWQQLHA